jgi:hypothetical protein
MVIEKNGQKRLPLRRLTVDVNCGDLFHFRMPLERAQLALTNSLGE